MMKRLLLFFALCSWLVGSTTLWAQTHTANYFINGVKIFSETIAEGTALNFPKDNSSIPDNVELAGWLPSELEASLKTAPVGMVTSTTMGNADVNYYAVFAEPLEYRLTSAMISQMDAEQAWDADEKAWYGVYNKNEVNPDTLRWWFKGLRSETYGTDKLCIGKEGQDSYIHIKAPLYKKITKVTVGIVSYATEKPTKYSYKGFFYLRTALNETNGQIVAGGEHQEVDNPLELATDGTRSDYYLQTSTLSRIYAVKLTCGQTGYRTALDADTITIGASGYSTLCLPWHAAVPEGVTAYRLKEVDLSKTSHQLRFGEVAGMIAGQGYLIKGTPGESYIFRRVYSQPEDPNLTNEMHGITERTAWSTLAVFTSDATLKPFILTSGGCFMQYTGTYIPAKKAFVAVNPLLIKYESESSAAELRVMVEEFDNYVTGLTEECIETKNASPVVYDLTGKQVPQIKRGGLYIVNGKSVLVK